MRKLKIAVLIRSVTDCRVPLPPDIYGEQPLPEGMMNVINPADWYALEQGLSLKTNNEAVQVLALSLGNAAAEEPLRWCIAAGADWALRLWDTALTDADALGRGKTLAAALARAKPDLVLCGDSCLDQLDDLLPGMVAAAAGLAYVPGVTGLGKIDSERAVVIRRLEKGKRERVVVKLPALIAMEEGGGAASYYADLPGTISAFTRPIPYKGLVCLGLSADRVGGRGAKVHSIVTRIARPLVTRPVTPDPNLPAEQRLRKILSGGVVRKQGEVVTGTTEQMVDKIIEFFRAQPVVRL